MDKENKAGKETFIFGSWKCRNPRKIRITSKDISSKKLEKKESTCINKDIRNLQSNNQNTSPSSSSIYNSFMTEERNEINVTRRATSVYDQLHEQDFWCPRCSSKMEEPRLLPCLHSVCNNCVNEFMSKDCQGLSQTVGDSISNNFQNRKQVEGCPTCDFPLPKYGSPTPPPHYSLQHRLVVYAVRRRLSQRVICCDVCPEEVQATQHCSHCLCNLCRECGAEHETHERTHNVRPLWEARSIRRVAVCLAHPEQQLRFHCLACQQPICRECIWLGEHRGHASEDVASAGSRASRQLSRALQKARTLLDSLLTEYNECAFETGIRSRTALDVVRDSMPKPCHFRSRSTISSHTKEARERIQEFSRLRRARYLIDAIFIGEDLLSNGSDVEILSLKRIILKRLKFLGVTIDAQVRLNSVNKHFFGTLHSGIYHCCTFCSSGGKKEAICACSGTMPGGYKGCGHGHPGHPGVYHWSCCGSIYPNGICLLPRKCTYKIRL